MARSSTRPSKRPRPPVRPPVPPPIAYPPMPVAGHMQVLDDATMTQYGAEIKTAATALLPYADGTRALPQSPNAWPIDAWLSLPGEIVSTGLVLAISANLNRGTRLDRTWWDLALRLVQHALDVWARRGGGLDLDDLIVMNELWEHVRLLEAKKPFVQWGQNPTPE